MKKHTLYELLLKILGVYLLVSLITNLSQVFTYFIFLVNANGSMFNLAEITSVIMISLSIISALLILVLIRGLLFKTSKIIKLINIENLEEVIFDGSINRQKVIETSLIIAGMVTIIIAIPEFMSSINIYASAIGNIFLTEEFDFGFITVTLFRIIVGVCCIKFSKYFSEYLIKSEKINLI
jgi:hypothetical protein